MKLRASLTQIIIAFACLSGLPCQAETIKIAFIDPFTGPAAAINESNTHHLQFVIDMANREGWAGPNTKFEIVDFDGKGSPQESVQQLKNATDQGIRYVIQGLSSAVGLALIDAINRHNERNPGKEVVYLNPTNTAPEMTGEKCSFWHFRFDSNVEMKTAGLVNFLSRDASLKKVYQINMNYATGQQISAAVRSDLSKSRPDIEIVGDDLHQMFQVKDFSPYVSKMKASGAQAIVTGNWSADLILLVKASKDASLKIPFYAYNAATLGIPVAMAAAGVEDLNNITYWNPNDDLKASKPIVEPYRAKYNDDFVALPYYHLALMLSKAIKDSNSTDPVVVARALEGMKVESLNGAIEMRKSDHQMQQPLFIAKWTKTNGADVFYDLVNTGYGFKTLLKVDPALTTLPSTCNMKRPS